MKTPKKPPVKAPSKKEIDDHDELDEDLAGSSKSKKVIEEEDDDFDLPLDDLDNFDSFDDDDDDY